MGNISIREVEPRRQTEHQGFICILDLQGTKSRVIVNVGRKRLRIMEMRDSENRKDNEE